MAGISVLTIITVFSAVLIGLLIYAFASDKLGITQLLQLFFKILSIIWDGIRTIFETISRTAPAPIKIGIFAVLFILFGWFVFYNTIGVPYVCHENKLYKGDYLSGLTYRGLPDDPDLVTITPEVTENENKIFTENHTISGFYQNVSGLFYAWFPRNSYQWVYTPRSVSSIGPYAGYSASFDDVTHDLANGVTITQFICRLRKNAFPIAIPEDICYMSMGSCDVYESLMDASNIIYDMYPNDDRLLSGKPIYNIWWKLNPSIRKVEVQAEHQGTFFGWTLTEFMTATLSKCKEDNGSVFSSDYTSYPKITLEVDGVSGTVYNVMAVPIGFEIIKGWYGGESAELNNYAFEGDNRDQVITSKVAAYKRTRTEFLLDEEMSGFKLANKSKSSDFVVVACEDNKVNVELAGLPIFDIKFIGLIAFISLIVGVMRFFRR